MDESIRLTGQHAAGENVFYPSTHASAIIHRETGRWMFSELSYGEPRHAAPSEWPAVDGDLVDNRDKAVS